MPHRILLLIALLGYVFVSTARVDAAETKPLRALLITGGCCHDYDNQKYILPQGISARANVEWTVVHQGGDKRDVKIDIYKQPDWAKGFDVVVHNECFGGVTDVDFVNQIAKVHHAGVPAVMIHCSLHSYRGAETDAWRELLGVSSFSHEKHRPLEVKNLKADHPIMRGFPQVWNTPNGELYKIEKIWPNATPLAQAYGVDTGQDHVCIWTNTYGKARVFGTSLGHHNETMKHEVYLNLVSRGLLWATGKLGDDGEPLPGYAGTGKPLELPERKPAATGEPTPARPQR